MPKIYFPRNSPFPSHNCNARAYKECPGTSQGIECDQSDTEERAADPNITTTSQAQPIIHPVSVSVERVQTLPTYTTGFDIKHSPLGTAPLPNKKYKKEATVNFSVRLELSATVIVMS